MGQALTMQNQKISNGVSQPHWLGDPGRHLYASLHRPAVTGTGLGVLLVSPLFHEQPRSRRLQTEVASGLAAAGLPSMRFDFFGTGDSAGSSDRADFSSMCIDLDLAASALRADAAVDRVAVLAWRGAALPVSHWLRKGGRATVVILWEPIADGAAWVNELDRLDAAERCSPQRYPFGHGAQAGDNGHLMGMAISPQLRRDLIFAHLAADERENPQRFWAIARPGMQALPMQVERTFALSADTPTFDGSTRMDQALFVSPRLQPVLDELVRALLEMA